MDDKVKQLTTQALEVCESLKNYSIVTPKKYEIASVDLKKAKEMLKAIDIEEKEITKPINAGLKRARDWFRPAKTKLSDIISRIGSEMFTFRRKQEAEARKKQEELDKQAEPTDMFVPQAEVEIPKTEVKVRRNWRFEVLDKNKLDSKYLIPDEKLIQMLVTKLKEKAEDIVGKGAIRIYFTETSY